MKTIIRIIALLLVVGIVFISASFGMSTEPDLSLTSALSFSFILAIISQAGLLLSTTKIGIRYKFFTAILMLPFALMLFFSNVELIFIRLPAGRPPLAIFAFFSLVGFFAYIYAYIQLSNSSVGRNN